MISIRRKNRRKKYLPSATVFPARKYGFPRFAAVLFGVCSVSSAFA